MMVRYKNELFCYLSTRASIQIIGNELSINANIKFGAAKV